MCLVETEQDRTCNREHGLRQWQPLYTYGFRFPKANLAILNIFFPTDTKLIPDEHYIHTDTVTNHHQILVLAFVSKQFIEMLSTFRLQMD